MRQIFPPTRVVAMLSPAPGGNSPATDREQDRPDIQY